HQLQKGFLSSFDIVQFSRSCRMPRSGAACLLYLAIFPLSSDFFEIFTQALAAGRRFWRLSYNTIPCPQKSTRFTLFSPQSRSFGNLPICAQPFCGNSRPIVRGAYTSCSVLFRQCKPALQFVFWRSPKNLFRQQLPPHMF
ncbi:hypothetical protein, partial [Allofournierella sp.]|uniref:hypothetical protein n=1 Tax=Allofournierella sp. TaxID=1940256 RepID=UPI003AB8259C